MKITHFWAVIGLGLTLASAPTLSSAATLFSNDLGSDVTGGNRRFQSTFSNDIGAEDFTLAQKSTVESFSFHAAVSNGLDFTGSSVAWSIRNDDTSLPGSSIFASGTDAFTTTDTGLLSSSNSLLRFDVDIADVTLNAATYWLTLFVNTPTDTGSVFWTHTTNGNDLTAVSTDGGVSWSTPYSAVSANEVFAIYGEPVSPVPLPAGGLLLLSGLMGATALKRSKTRAT